MQVILIVLFFLVAIPLALKFPKYVKAIFRGIFSFITYFIKNAPAHINENASRYKNEKKK